MPVAHLPPADTLLSKWCRRPRARPGPDRHPAPGHRSASSRMNAPYVWAPLALHVVRRRSPSPPARSALFAALGSLGQLVAMLLFVYLALASSGGTIPLQALPWFVPLRRQLRAAAPGASTGSASILYFGASGDRRPHPGRRAHRRRPRPLGHSSASPSPPGMTAEGLDRLQPEVLDFGAALRAELRRWQAGARTAPPLPRRCLTSP